MVMNLIQDPDSDKFERIHVVVLIGSTAEGQNGSGCEPSSAVREPAEEFCSDHGGVGVQNRGVWVAVNIH